MHFLNDIDFPSLIAKQQNGRMRSRLMALSHIKNDANRTQTAKYLQVSRRMVNEWVKRFNEKGIDGLIEKPRSGRPRALSTEQFEKRKEYVVSHAIKPDCDRLKGTLVIAYAE